MAEKRSIEPPKLTSNVSGTSRRQLLMMAADHLVEQHGARNDLNRLVKLGCDRDRLRFELASMMEAETLDPCWNSVSKSIYPSQHIGLNAAKKRLVQHVKHKTGKPHDSEVSALIDVVAPRKEGTYDEVAHRYWRSRNMP